MIHYERVGNDMKVRAVFNMPVIFSLFIEFRLDLCSETVFAELLYPGFEQGITPATGLRYRDG